MCNTGHAIKRRLDMLTGISELLKASQAPMHARELSQRAKALIRQLANELDQLALEAEHDFEWIT
jgi:ubiquinone biosynthesis protein COQ9